MAEPSTTIKVPVRLRDEIKKLAQEKHESMPSIIEEMLECYLIDQRMVTLKRQVEQTSSAEMREYETETTAMDGAYQW